MSLGSAAPPQASDDAATAPLAKPAALTFSIDRAAYDGALDALPRTLPGLDTLDAAAQLSGSLHRASAPRLPRARVRESPAIPARKDRIHSLRWRLVRLRR